jgi:hypothetical protein
MAPKLRIHTQCYEIRFQSPSAYHSEFTCTIVCSSVYSNSPPFTALSLNFAPAETSLSTFLVIIAVCENDVVISLVLFLAIIMMAVTSEIRATPKAVYKT